MRRRTFIAGAALAVLGACTNDGGIVASTSEAQPSPLPSPERTDGAGLDEVLGRRRSVRAFTPEPLDEDTIAHLLWAAQGVTAIVGRPDRAIGRRLLPDRGLRGDRRRRASLCAR